MRIRSVKPEFYRDADSTGVWPIDEKLVYAGLWSVADDEGRMVWNVRQIRADLFPYPEGMLLTAGGPALDLDGVLERLIASGRVVLYELDDKTYAHLPNFKKHQKVSKPTPSRLPPPSAGSPPHETPPSPPPGRGPDPGNSGNAPGTLPESSWSPTGRKGNGYGDGKRNGDGKIPPTPHRTPGALPPPRPARIGVGGPAYEAVEHWRSVAWPAMSTAPASPVTTPQASRLAQLTSTHGIAEVRARMDRAVADSFWRDKLDLDLFLEKFDRFAPRRAAAEDRDDDDDQDDAPSRRRRPGENPKPGDPDFNDPRAWGDYGDFLKRTDGRTAEQALGFKPPVYTPPKAAWEKPSPKPKEPTP